MLIVDFKNYLKSLGVNPNKTYGQNFLHDDIVLQDIVDAAEVSKEDFVIEVGPGIGNLTRLLCERAGKVLAIEKDEQFRFILKRLQKEFKNLEVVYSDVLKVDFGKLLSSSRMRGSSLMDSGSAAGMTHPYKVVANIPYYITGKITQLFLRTQPKPKSLTMLVQKEVAQNIVAKPGELGLLAISVQLVGEGTMVRVVPKESFFPAPKVTSAVVRIDIDKKEKYPELDEDRFFKLLHAAFLGKRKQLHNTLTNNLMLPKEDVEKILMVSKISSIARPQELSLEDWVRLYKEIEN